MHCGHSLPGHTALALLFVYINMAADHHLDRQRKALLVGNRRVQAEAQPGQMHRLPPAHEHIRDVTNEILDDVGWLHKMLSDPSFEMSQESQTPGRASVKNETACRATLRSSHTCHWPKQVVHVEEGHHALALA